MAQGRAWLDGAAQIETSDRTEILKGRGLTSNLGDRFEGLWSEGQALTLAQAVALAQAGS